MDPDTEEAAWAQLENEAQSYNEILASDPAYADWLNRFEQQEYENAEG